jgi:WD40 repeat protein
VLEERFRFRLEAEKDGKMADIFISYSRTDKDFIHQLHDAFKREARDVWVDVEDIPHAAPWREEIADAIEAAHTFVFVISPDAVRSPYCNQELDHAVTHHKRIVPIVFRDVNPESARKELADLNWIFFRLSNNFEEKFHSLIAAIDTDLDWVKAHTRYLVKSIDWEKNGRNSSFALRGVDLKEAEQWLTLGPQKDPNPTSLQTEYMIASRKVQIKRQRITFSAIVFGLVIATVLSLTAFFQHRAKERQRQIALARQLVAQSEMARDQGEDQLEKSLWLATTAMKQFQSLGLRSLEADLSMRRSMALLPKSVRSKTFEKRGGEFAAAAFSVDEDLLVSAEKRGDIQIWNIGSDRDVTGWKIDLNAMSSIKDVAMSSDGKLLASLTYDASAAKSLVNLWDIESNRRTRPPLSLPGMFDNMKLSPDGRYVALGKPVLSRIWNLQNSREIQPWRSQFLIRDLDFSPDGQYLAALVRKRQTKTVLLTVLDLASQQEVSRWPQDRGVSTIWWSGDGEKLVAASKANKVWLWQVGQAQKVSNGTYKGAALAFSPDAKYIAAKTGTYTVKVYNLASGKEFMRMVHTAEVIAAAFSQDGSYLTTVSLADHTARVWEVGNDQEVAKLVPVNREKNLLFGRKSSLMFSPGGKYFATVYEDGSLRVWDATNWRELIGVDRERALEVFTREVAESAIIRGEKEIPRQKESTAKGQVALARSPDGKYQVTGNGEIWDIDRRKKVRVLSHDEAIQHAFFSPDSRYLFTVSGPPFATRGGWRVTALAWKVSNWKEVPDFRFQDLSDIPLQNLRFSRDGKYLIFVGRSGVKLWDGRNLRPIIQIYHQKLSSFDISPNQELLATAGEDHAARVWEIDSGREVVRVVHNAPVNAVTFSPDEKWLATAAADQTVRIFWWRPQDMITEACSRLTRIAQRKMLDEPTCPPQGARNDD